MRREKAKYLYFIYYFVFFMGIGVYTTYFTVYLKGNGFSSSDIGLIAAVCPFMTVLGQFILGRIADRMSRINRLMAVLFISCTVVLIFFPLSSSFIYVMVLNCIYTFFSCPFFNLSDAMTLEYCVKNGITYDRIRLGGSAGYAIMAGIAGIFISMDNKNVFRLCACIYVISCAFVLLLPQQKRIHTREREKSEEKLLKPSFLLVLFVNLVAYTSLGFYNTFFPIYIRESDSGNDYLPGIAVLIAVLCELPFCMFAKKIIDKVGIKSLMLFSCFSMAVRWLLFSMTTNTVLLLIINSLNVSGPIVLVYCSIHIIHDVAPPSRHASAQTMLGIVTYGISRIIGNYFGGILSDFMGIGNTFAAVGCFVLAGTFAFMLLSKSIRKENSV